MTEQPAVKETTSLVVFTPEMVNLIRNTVAVGATDDELKLFFFECKRRGVHPLDRLIHFVKRRNKDGSYKVAFQTSIDLFRSQAEETGDYRGQEDIVYGGMIQIANIDKPVPESATARIRRHDRTTGSEMTVSATAYWDEYYPGDQLGFNWRRMPRLMLGKCAEALALRKAFPRKLAGLYTFEEMSLQINEPLTKGRKPLPEEPQKKAVSALPEARSKLNEELLLASMTDEGIDTDRYAKLLRECTFFKDKGVEHFMENVFDERSPQGTLISEKWVNSAIGRLRDEVAKQLKNKPVEREPVVSDRG